jgi:uncharacterized membrane protein
MMLEQILARTSLPNAHPALVHFPIVLLSLAVLIECIALLRRSERPLQVAAVLLYVFGSISAVLTWLSGRQASDSVGMVDAQTEILISEHSDFGMKTAWIFAVVALGHLAVVLLRRRVEKPVILVLRIVLLAAALFGFWLLMATADRGGALVYRHGVAVRGRQDSSKETSATSTEFEDRASESQTTNSAQAPTPLMQSEDGAVAWRPKPGESAALGEVVTVVRATPGAQVRVVDGAEAAEGLSIESSGRIFLLLPQEFDNVLVVADVDLSGFAGHVGLVHHFQSDSVYECMQLEDQGSAALLDHGPDRKEQLDRASAGWPARRVRVAVSAAGSHLKGYVDGQTVVHGHRPVRGKPGRNGLMLDGEGRVRILELRLTSVPSEH